MAIVRFDEIHAHSPINKAYEIRSHRSLLGDFFAHITYLLSTESSPATAIVINVRPRVDTRFEKETSIIFFFYRNKIQTVEFRTYNLLLRTKYHF